MAALTIIFYLGEIFSFAFSFRSLSHLLPTTKDSFLSRVEHGENLKESYATKSIITHLYDMLLYLLTSSNSFSSVFYCQKKIDVGQSVDRKVTE